MKLIESPYALTALKKMAEYTPDRLLEMEKAKPKELYKEIELRVTNAIGWTETAMGKGAASEKMEEVMDNLLKPEYIPENRAAIQISDDKIREIHQKLIALAEF